MAWNWVDLLIIGIIALSVITGLFRGFVKELIAIGVWILAIWFAIHYSSLVTPYIRPYVSDTRISNVIAFVIVVLGTLILGGLANAIVGMLLKSTGLSSVDRILGMGFGFIRGVFIVSLIMLVLKLTSLPYQSYTHQSQLWAKFNPIVNYLSSFTPGLINKFKSLHMSSMIDDFKLDINPAP
jgi:membrane protein required for colicin V production